MSPVQPTFFEDDPTDSGVANSPPSRSLVFKPQRGRPLSKAERTFNQLVTRV